MHKLQSSLRPESRKWHYLGRGMEQLEGGGIRKRRQWGCLGSYYFIYMHKSCFSQFIYTNKLLSNFIWISSIICIDLPKEMSWKSAHRVQNSWWEYLFFLEFPQISVFLHVSQGSQLSPLQTSLYDLLCQDDAWLWPHSYHLVSSTELLPLEASLTSSHSLLISYFS